jgi:hypothetical protein
MIECVNDCTRIITNDLKSKSEDYLWGQFKPYHEQKVEDIPRNDIYEKEDTFDFEIRVDNRSVAKRTFTGNVYPQRVRYSVDIRKIIPPIIDTIQETLSSENFDVEYSGIDG